MTNPPVARYSRKSDCQTNANKSCWGMTTYMAFSPWLAEQRFVAFDTETTGLWAASNRIVEIAGVAFRPGSDQTESFQELVNPGTPIPDEVVGIHGITDDMVADADSVGPVLARFFEFCGDEAILIAHNAPFDISFVAWELLRAELPAPTNAILDSRPMAAAGLPGLPSYSLESLAMHLELIERQEHRALSDAELVRGVFFGAAPSFLDCANRTDFFERFRPLTFADSRPEEVALPAEFADLGRAINESRMVEIEYTKAGAEPHVRRITPLRIHGHNGNIYVNAFCRLANDERTFRLDRIRRVRLID
ncbi:WYL domain-containing protein [candidate division GN15 bacterium]|nr:WYL domain-containing protein [candidate division GN15 bacterium]